MSENERIVQAMLDSANRRDPAAIHAYLAEAMHAVNPRLGTSAASRMHWAQTALMEGFPDLQYQINRITSSGDTVVIECTLSGTHKGTFAGAPATQSKIELEAAFCVEIVGGKMTDCRAYFDTGALMEQIGARPAPAQQGVRAKA
jgi:steroid delta-isomerase-like uncharacterized protein